MSGSTVTFTCNLCEATSGPVSLDEALNWDKKHQTECPNKPGTVPALLKEAAAFSKADLEINGGAYALDLARRLRQAVIAEQTRTAALQEVVDGLQELIPPTPPMRACVFRERHTDDLCRSCKQVFWKHAFRQSPASGRILEITNAEAEQVRQRVRAER